MTSKKMLKSMLFFFLALLISVHADAQEGTVNGTVVDAEDGAGLPGATLLVKGTTTGTTTDIDGNFSLLVEPNTILVVSYVSYKTQEITVRSSGVAGLSG